MNMGKIRSIAFTTILLTILLAGACTAEKNGGGDKGTTMTPGVTADSTPSSVPEVTSAPDNTPASSATPMPTASNTPTLTPTALPVVDALQVSDELADLAIGVFSQELLTELGLASVGDKETVLKVWNWVKENVKSGEDRKLGSEKKYAYAGLTEKKGGIVTQNALFALLLEEYGIQHVAVSAKDAKYNHSWNICKIDENWYHFDYFKPEKGNYICFMQNDEQVKAMTMDLYPDFNYYDLAEGLPMRNGQALYNGYMEKWIGEPELSLTEAQIQSKLKELKVLYPSGKYWNSGGVTDKPCDHNAPYTNGKQIKNCNKYVSILNRVYVHGGAGSQCLGFGSLLSDYVFGTEAGVYAFTDYDDLRVGDLFRIMVKPNSLNKYYHTAMIIEKNQDYVLVAEVNYDFDSCKIRWGGKYTREFLEARGTWYIGREYNLIEEKNEP